MPLYGNELDRDDDPVRGGSRAGREARQGRATSSGAPPSRRSPATAREARSSGSSCAGRGIARHGYPVFAGDRRTGVVTSGTQSPTLGTADRDGLRRTGRRRAGYDGRRRDPRAARPGARSSPCRSTGDRAEAQAAVSRPTQGGSARMIPRICATPRTTSGSASRATRRRSGSPTTPPSSSATSSSSSCPTPGARSSSSPPFGVVESVKAVSDLFAPVERRGDRDATRSSADSPELVNSDPYGEGWMVRIRIADADQLDEPARRGRLRRADRGGLTAPHAIRSAHRRRPGSGCSAALGLASVDELFADIPAALRAGARLDLPDPSPSSSWPPGCSRLAARNRTDLASFLGAGVYRHWTPAGGRPAAAARRVVHGLHAVPAGGQPGHAPDASTSTSR